MIDSASRLDTPLYLISTISGHWMTDEFLLAQDCPPHIVDQVKEFRAHYSEQIYLRGDPRRALELQTLKDAHSFVAFLGDELVAGVFLRPFLMVGEDGFYRIDPDSLSGGTLSAAAVGGDLASCVRPMYESQAASICGTRMIVQEMSHPEVELNWSISNELFAYLITPFRHCGGLDYRLPPDVQDVFAQIAPEIEGTRRQTSPCPVI